MKTKVKILCTLFITFFIMFLIGTTNKVQATSVTEEYLQNMLNVVPNEIELNIKESEYEKAESIVKQKVEEIWKEKNIDTEGIGISYWAASLYTNIDEFYNAGINLYSEGINSVSKIISIKYTDTNQKNKEDEQYVKQLVLPKAPDYVTFDFFSKNAAKDAFGEIAKYYENKINDSSLKFIVSSGAYGDHNLDFGTESKLVAIFKNGLLYDIRRIEDKIDTIGQIIIPQDVKDTTEDYINYATPIIKEFWKEICDTGGYLDYKYTGNISFIKGLKTYGNIEVEDGYIVKQDDDIIGRIILKKEFKDIVQEEKENGIKLETNTSVVPVNTTLVSKKVEDEKTLKTVKESLKEISNKYVTFDISLINDNTKIQPNGKVKISIPIPSDYDTSKLVVYRIESNGEKVEYNVTVNGNMATFETDHFSTYVLAERTTEEASSKDNTENEKDDTPKTGTKSSILYIAILTIVAGISILVIRKK